MASPSVSPSKQRSLERRMRELGIREEDIEERFVRGSGRGGQKINKTSSCVQLLHRPTGIDVRCGRERSQAMNRFLARRELCERVAARVHGEKTRRQQEAEKERRRKRRRSRRQKQRMLREKRLRSRTKNLRKPPGPEE